MKRFVFLFVIILGPAVNLLNGQNDSSKWQFDFEANNYFFKGGDYIFVPLLKADKNWLHLEARYNYEDLQTFSGWVGYNFSGGNKLSYLITPMVGYATGLTKGVTTGLEITLVFGKFEFYSEGEFLFDTQDKANNFYYHWADITFSPRDWWWVGITGQRTKLYQTDLEIQRGFVVGGALGNWEFTGYLYNLGFGEPFFLFTAGVKF